MHFLYVHVEIDVHRCNYHFIVFVYGNTYMNHQLPVLQCQGLFHQPMVNLLIVPNPLPFPMFLILLIIFVITTTSTITTIIQTACIDARAPLCVNG